MQGTWRKKGSSDKNSGERKRNERLLTFNNTLFTQFKTYITMKEGGEKREKSTNKTK